MSADYSAIPVEVMDELDRYAASLGDPHQTGALLLLAHVRIKQSAKRYEKARGPIKPAKLRRTDG